MNKTISFIFPSPSSAPAGGYKVAYEYANRLAAEGYKVNIVYSGSIFWKKKDMYHKVTNCIRYVQQLIKGYSCRKWFLLDKRVKEVFSFSLNYRHIPKSDLFIATSPFTAMYVKDYPVDAKNKFYFIQGYENWGGITDEILRETYHYDMQIIVISKWLGNIMDEEGVKYHLVYNGFDFNYFKLNNSISNRDKFQVAMVYSTTPVKDCNYGFDALIRVKKIFPELKVNIYGSSPRPNLPEWYNYTRCPNRIEHNSIYNESAIFVATSSMEGWGLTVGEAMICGDAVVCTDNLGYKEMAIDGETALISPIKNSQSLADNIVRLIEDDELRYRIATNGNEAIKKFSINKSYERLKNALGLE